MAEGFRLKHSSKTNQTTRAKVFSPKKTVGITLPQNLIERVRKHNLNISKVTEQALTSIIDYLETQNTQNSQFLNERSFQKEISWCGCRDLNPSYRLGKPKS